MPEPVRIAHLTDIHLPPPPGIELRDLMNKRLTGYLNWQRNRRSRQLRSVVDKLTNHLAEQTVDHISVTGDLVNLGLPDEFDAALEWLGNLGAPERVSVIPGNHDTYVAMPGRSCFEVWRDYMQGNSAIAKAYTSDPVIHEDVIYPHVHVVGHVAIIGLSSAIPTRWFNAEGNIGQEQLALLPKILDDLRDEGKFRIVTVHHPPSPELATARKGLRDAGRLLEILRNHGAELVLYGHNHIQRLSWLEGCTGRFAAVCTPSLSAASAKHPPLGRYNLFEVPSLDSTGAWQCSMTGYGLVELDAPIRRFEPENLSPRLS